MEIDDLEISLNGTSESGVAAVDALVAALDKLQSSLGGVSSPVSKAVKSLDKLTATFDKMSSASGAVKGADQAAASMARVEKAASSTAASVSSAAHEASQSTVSAAQKAADKVAASTYKARLDAKVAAQEQIQADKVVAAQKIAAIKGAQQVEVSAQKAALTASKQVQSQESKAAQVEALMAEKRKQEEAEWARLADEAVKASNAARSTGAESYSGPLYGPTLMHQSPAKSADPVSESSSASQPEALKQPVSALQRLQNAAAGAQRSMRNLFSGASVSPAEGNSALDTLNAKLDNANEGIRIQELKLQNLRVAWAAAFDASGANNADENVIKLDDAILSANKSLVSYREQAGRAAQQIQKLNSVEDQAVLGMNRVSRSMNSASSGSSGLERSLSRMGRQLASQLIIYSIIWPEISKIGQYTGTALMTNNAFSASLNNLRVQLLTAFNPIYTASLPALTSLINALAKATAYVAAFLSGLFGTTYAQSQKSASALNNNVKALQAMDAAAKKAKKSLGVLGFDELNVLQNPATSSSSTGIPSALNGIENTNFNNGQSLIPESAIKAAEAAGAKVSKVAGSIVSALKTPLGEIAGLFIGTGLLALGAVLTFTGVAMPLGIALMAAGAATLATTAALNWDSISKELKTPIGMVVGLFAGTALLALGAALAFSGVALPLGIGLMAMGAVSLATAALNWDALSPKMKGTVAAISGIIGAFSLAIGAVLAFTGANVPLGVALMAVGAASLAAVAAVNWNSMSPQISGELSVIFGALSGAFLAIGAILAFSGANLPLGIALMAMGAAGIVAAIAINWHSNDGHVSDAISTISGIVGGAFLAVGALLAFTGVNVPLGIALIAAGAVTLASVIAVNWNALNSPLQNTISIITSIVGGALLALGAVLAFSGVNSVLGIALMSAGAAVLVSTIAVNWNSMSNSLRTTITAVTLIVGGALLALGAILCFTGVGIPLGIALLAAGAASIVAAVALNWGFVKDMIKSILADILAIVSVSGVAIGLLLCLTGAGIPLGIALIFAGMKGVSAASKISKNPITDWAKALMNGVIDIFEKGINWIISMLDKISFTVPSWVAGIGGQKYGINIAPVHFPRLANGGITDVNNPFLAVVGDNKTQREVVSPLDDLMKMIRTAISGAVATPPELSSLVSYASRFSGGVSSANESSGISQVAGQPSTTSGNSGDVNLTLAVQIGGDTLTTKVIEGLRKKALATGKIAVPV